MYCNRRVTNVLEMMNLSRTTYKNEGQRLLSEANGIYYKNATPIDQIPSFIKDLAKKIASPDESKMTQYKDTSAQIWSFEEQDNRGEVLPKGTSFIVDAIYAPTFAEYIGDQDLRAEFQSMKGEFDIKRKILRLFIEKPCLKVPGYYIRYESVIDHELRHYNDFLEGNDSICNFASSYEDRKENARRINSGVLIDLNAWYFERQMRDVDISRVNEFRNDLACFFNSHEILAYLHSFRDEMLNNSAVVNMNARNVSDIFNERSEVGKQFKKYVSWHEDPNSIYEFICNDIPFLPLLSITLETMHSYSSIKGKLLLLDKLNILYHLVGGRRDYDEEVPDFTEIPYMRLAVLNPVEEQVMKVMNDICLVCQKILCTVIRKIVIHDIDHMIVNLKKVFASFARPLLKEEKIEESESVRWLDENELLFFG